jgi:iron complex outermembrane receptor protein
MKPQARPLPQITTHPVAPFPALLSQRWPHLIAAGLAACSLVATTPLRGQATGGTNRTEAKSEVIELSPFEVKATDDQGYRAANSVSATRIQVPLRDLPMTVNAFTEEFIADQKARSLWEVVRFAPGVTNSNPEFNGGSAVYNVRGFNTATTLRNGFAGPTVLETANIARVDVVKGPGSLLYGNIEPGGVINYITKRPQQKPGVQFEQSIGTDGFWRTTADVTGPIGSANSPVLFRVIGSYDNAPEFFDPYEKHTSLIAPSLTWNIGSKTKINFDYEKFEEEETPPLMGPQGYVVGGINLGPAPGVDFFFNAASYADYRTSDSSTYSIDGTTELFGWDFRLAYSYNEQQIDQLNTAALTGTTPALRTINRRGRLQSNAWEDETYQFEATHRFDFNTSSLTVLLGTQIGNRLDFGYQNALPGAMAPAPWQLDNPATWIRTIPWTIADLTIVNSNYGIQTDREGYYGVAHLRTLKDRLHVLGGLRRSRAESLTTDRRNGTTSGYFKQYKTTPQAGVLGQITKQVSAFVSYSESYQPQGGSLITKGVPGKSKVPLEGKGYDVGLRFGAEGGPISANISYFELEYAGFVRQFNDGIDANGNVLISQEQNGTDQSKGFEFDALWTPGKNWQVLATYAHVEPTHKINTNAAIVGLQLSNTVEDTANIWIKYVLPDGRLKGLSFAGGVSYTGPRRVADTSPVYYDEAYVVDFLASYSWTRGKLQYGVDLSLKNLLDEHYFLSGASRAEPFRSSLAFRIKL